jgi:hypothetical protein
VAALPHTSIVAVTVLADPGVVVAADLVDAGAVAVTELNDLAVVVATALEGLGTVAVVEDVLPAYAEDASESTAAETRRMERSIIFSLLDEAEPRDCRSPHDSVPQITHGGGERFAFASPATFSERHSMRRNSRFKNRDVHAIVQSCTARTSPPPSKEWT